MEPVKKIMPLTANEKEVIRNFFLFRLVFILARDCGVIFLYNCLEAVIFSENPLAFDASIGDTLLAMTAGLLIEHKTAR